MKKYIKANIRRNWIEGWGVEGYRVYIPSLKRQATLYISYGGDGIEIIFGRPNAKKRDQVSRNWVNTFGEESFELTDGTKFFISPFKDSIRIETTE